MQALERSAHALAAGLAVIALLVSASPRSAAACSCGELSPVEAVAAAELVAEVEAGVSEPVDPRIEADAATTPMLVIRVFRGEADEGRELPVRAGTESSACGVAFEPGRRYLLFANRDEARLWRTDSCSHTRRIEHAERELQRLEREAASCDGASEGP